MYRVNQLSPAKSPAAKPAAALALVPRIKLGSPELETQCISVCISVSAEDDQIRHELEIQEAVSLTNVNEVRKTLEPGIWGIVGNVVKVVQAGVGAAGAALDREDPHGWRSK